jgi:hypothetical protein
MTNGYLGSLTSLSVIPPDGNLRPPSLNASDFEWISLINGLAEFKALPEQRRSTLIIL